MKNQKNNEPDFKEINPEKVSQTIDSIDKALSGKKVDKKIRQKITYAPKTRGYNHTYQAHAGTGKNTGTNAGEPGC